MDLQPGAPATLAAHALALYTPCALGLAQQAENLPAPPNPLSQLLFVFRFGRVFPAVPLPLTPRIHPWCKYQVTGFGPGRDGGAKRYWAVEGS